MSEPAILLRRVPTNLREWDQELSRVGCTLRFNGERTFVGDYRGLQPINVANRNSVQNANDIMEAVSGALTATINVDAHTVRYATETGYRDVSYNSGSITGLLPDTAYIVFVEDHNYKGGAVVYEATTNPDNVIRSGYYYVGTIDTPIAGNSQDILAATSANPIVFQTSAPHGWSSGQEVTLGGLPGDFGSNLNGNEYTLTVVDPTHFSIAVDGSAYVAFTTGGTATRSTTATQSGGGAGAGVGGNRFDFR